MKCIVPALITILLCAIHAVLFAQDPVWNENLGVAQTAAANQSKSLLLLFTSPDAASSRKVEQSLAKPSLKKELEGLILVRLDLASNKDFANKLGVYRSGVILLYDSKGKGLARISDTFSAEDLLAKIQQGLGKYIAPLSTVSGSPVKKSHKELPKGKQIGESVTRSAADGTPVRLGVLETGKKYVLVLEGEFSTKRVTTRILDPLYEYEKGGNDPKRKVSNFIRLKDSGTTLGGFLLESNKKLPPFHRSHVYEVLVNGDGRELTLFFWEKEERNYTDNAGQVTFSLYEAGP